MGEIIPVQATGMERPAPGYLATPKTGSGAPRLCGHPGVVGLNDPKSKKTADRLAEAGYRALVPDFYRGKVATASDEAKPPS